MDRFRFTNSDGSVVRLDLNDLDGWTLGRGLDLGTRATRNVYLSQDGVDGATLASTSLEIAQMTIPIKMGRRPADTDAMLGLYQDLIDELRRETNTIEVRPTGWTGGSFFIDTFRAPEPHLVGGLELPDVFRTLEAGDAIVLTVDRMPKSRGAGDYL